MDIKNSHWFRVHDYKVKKKEKPTVIISLFKIKKQSKCTFFPCSKSKLKHLRDLRQVRRILRS